MRMISEKRWGFHALPRQKEMNFEHNRCDQLSIENQYNIVLTKALAIIANYNDWTGVPANMKSLACVVVET